MTGAGHDFLETSRIVIADLEHGVKRATQAGRGQRGRLRIGVFASVATGFPHDALATFLERHPGVSIDIVEGAPREHLQHIQERRIDLAWVTGNPEHEKLSSEQFWTERVALALPATHVLARVAVLEWRDLSEVRFTVSRDEPGPEIQEWLIARLGKLGRHPDILRQTVARETLLVLVGLGIGLTVVSEAATGVSYPGVVYRFFEREEDVLPFYAVWSDENDNPAVRRLLSLMRALAHGKRLPTLL